MGWCSGRVGACCGRVRIQLGWGSGLVRSSFGSGSVGIVIGWGVARFGSGSVGVVFVSGSALFCFGSVWHWFWFWWCRYRMGWVRFGSGLLVVDFASASGEVLVWFGRALVLVRSVSFWGVAWLGSDRGLLG